MINKMSNALLKATSGSFTKVLMTYVIATTILGQFVPSIIATFVMVTPMVKNTCEKMNISPSKMMFPVAIASVSCSFLVIPIGPYAADYVMYNGYLESYGWYDTAFTIWTDTPVLVITGIFTILVSVFLVPKLLPDQPDVEIGEIKRRAMKQKEPLDPVREMLGYGVFVVVILGLMTGILPAWEVTMIGALVVVATGVLTEQEAIDNLNMDTIMLYVGVSVLGTALGGTGAAELMGSALASLLGNTTNGYIIGAAFYIVAWLMTSFLYNRGGDPSALSPGYHDLRDHECRSHRPHHPVQHCLNVLPGHPYGHRRCSLGDDRRRLQSKDHLQGRHGARRGPWCGQRVGDHDHVPYLNRLLQPACVLIKIPARYPVREFF